MSYFGTTQASSVANPPQLIAGPFAQNPFQTGSTMFLTTQGSTAAQNTNNSGGRSMGAQLWTYVSTNETTDVTGANFFVDAAYIGMRAGDLVMGAWFTSQGSSAVCFLGLITSVSTAGASLSTGSLITSTFN
jgi:hypothetical protein